MAELLTRARLPIQDGVGVVGVTVFDSSGAILLVRSTVGITRIFEGDGVSEYRATKQLPTGTYKGYTVWDDGSGNGVSDTFVILDTQVLTETILLLDTTVVSHVDGTVLTLSTGIAEDLVSRLHDQIAVCFADGKPSVRRVVSLIGTELTIDAACDDTLFEGDVVNILVAFGGSGSVEEANSGGGVLNARIAYSSLAPDEFLEIIQGEEKVITFIVEADGRFDQEEAAAISVKLKDPIGGTVTKNNASITRITEELDVQVFRTTLSPDDTNDLTSGLLRIEIAFDSQKAVLTHAVKVIESL